MTGKQIFKEYATPVIILILTGVVSFFGTMILGGVEKTAQNTVDILLMQQKLERIIEDVSDLSTLKITTQELERTVDKLETRVNYIEDKK